MMARTYRITIEGRLSDRFASAFEGMTMTAGDGRTVLVGDGMDQGHLYGVLDRIRAFGLELVSVEDQRT